MNFDTILTDLNGIGSTRAALFASLGIRTAGEMLFFFPRAYENRGRITNIAEAEDDSVCSFIVTITGKALEHVSQSGMRYVKASASDGTGNVDLFYFNQRWMLKTLLAGRKFRVYGRVSRGMFDCTMASPITEAVYESKPLADIVPVYPLTKGLTQKIVADAVKACLPLCEEIEEVLPEEMRADHGLLPKKEAVRLLHSPPDEMTAQKARRSLAFEELVVFQSALKMLRAGKETVLAPSLSTEKDEMESFCSSLPFELTGAQRKAIMQILSDIQKKTPMTRLVQGDVGSGKTVISAAAIYQAVKSGHQAVMMAPTEILAAQHAKTLTKLLGDKGVKVGLLTGSMKAKDKQRIKELLAEGEIDVAVGTHALIQGDTLYKRLGLAVTDEQHRFGVMQRATLIEKGAESKENYRVHTLVMSATPIPRTLSLILYGDLDVSVINEMPPGRQKVDTYSVDSTYRTRIFNMIKKEVDKGHQAYIVCPNVEQKDGSERKAVEEYSALIEKSVLKDTEIGFVHGKLGAKTKKEVMDNFVSGRTKILVSTTVIEVGVDVPNSTVMFIEDADCFGLSQLHQLRGRVGRGEAKSYCILMSDSKSEKTKERLDIMCATNDGFEIAEADLRQRGPGDFFGERQSGESFFRYADASDMDLITQTSQAVGEMFGKESLPERIKKGVFVFFERTKGGITIN